MATGHPAGQSCWIFLGAHKTGSQVGRPPYLLEMMLRIHLMQNWYSLSDSAMEDALIEGYSMRCFARINLCRDKILDETTILAFQHILEKKNLAEKIFKTVKEHLSFQGIRLSQGIIVDVTIIKAPSSTKNKKRQRDPEMYQTCKGNQWMFGMKVHIGVDKDSGLIHSVVTTAANVHDLTPDHLKKSINLPLQVACCYEDTSSGKGSRRLAGLSRRERSDFSRCPPAAELLHDNEEVVYGDTGYQGIEKRPEMAGKTAKFRTAMRPGKRRQLSNTPADRLIEWCERAKAHIRAKVEHPFRVIKQQFGFQKTRFRGIDKNSCKVTMLAALTNLFLARNKLLISTES